MPSHLTRGVFRRLLANEPLLHYGCVRRPQISRPAYAPKLLEANISSAQRRTFLNLFKPAKVITQEADLDPGLEKMMQYEKMLRLGARLPPLEDVEKAWMKYFLYRKSNNNPVEDEQAKYLLPALRYLKDQQSSVLTLKHLSKLVERLSVAPPKHSSEDHVQLFLTIHATVDAIFKEKGKKMNFPWIARFVKALCVVKGARFARDMLQKPIQGSMDNKESAEEELSELAETENEMQESVQGADGAWRFVLRAFADEGNQDELLRTLDTMREAGLDVEDPRTCKIMAEFYAKQRELAAAKTWYEKFLKAGPSNITAPENLYRPLLQLCAKEKDWTWGQTLAQHMLETFPSKQTWDLVFYWAALSEVGVDTIAKMMQQAKNSGDESSATLNIDVDTFSLLIEHATRHGDPYTAERFIDQARRRGITPNVKILTLQMEYRLKVNDVDGALIAYQHLQKHDLSSQEDVSISNQLLCALCGSGRHDFDTIMNVAADLSDRQARFTPITISTLAILHITRGEIPDATDLLNTHAFHYSTVERASIRDALVAYCTNPATGETQAWDTYTTLRQFFDDMDRSQRTHIMQSLFQRERPDLGVSVFMDMRRHSRQDAMADSETYVTALLSISKLQDIESLDLVYNQLKLDYITEPSTLLRNALMIAFSACDQPRRAYGFWEEIATSREGPNINSIHLALKACEKISVGGAKARAIWERLGDSRIELDQDLWASYCAALMGDGSVQGTLSTLENAVEADLVVVNGHIIGSIFNAAPGQEPQTRVEEWAKQKYPGLWTELTGSVRVRETADGMRYFDVDRQVEP